MDWPGKAKAGVGGCLCPHRGSRDVGTELQVMAHLGPAHRGPAVTAKVPELQRRGDRDWKEIGAELEKAPKFPERGKVRR